MKKRFIFTVEVEGSSEDLEALENRLNVAVTRKVRSTEGVSFLSAESQAIELTERKRGIHPISPSVDYQNFLDETTE